MLLFIAHVMIHAMWRYKIDPDSSAIPYLTALGDLFGSSLLMGAFAFLRFVGHEYEGRGPPSAADFDLSTPASLLLSAFGAN
jgi:solute carrier family 41